MSDDDELFRLNSLHRYEKRSRLLLEAHSHCEVPAGCGGAVLQWVNPARGPTVRVHVQASVRVSGAFIDGAPVPGLGVRVPDGPHVLSLAFAGPEPRAGKPWVLVFLELRQPGVPTFPVQRLARSESRADGTWLALAGTPPPGWNSPTFDDSSWTPLKRAGSAGEGLEPWRRHAFDQELAHGSEPLGLPASVVHVRKRFVTATGAR